MLLFFFIEESLKVQDNTQSLVSQKFQQLSKSFKNISVTIGADRYRIFSSFQFVDLSINNHFSLLAT